MVPSATHGPLMTVLILHEPECSLHPCCVLPATFPAYTSSCRLDFAQSEAEWKGCYASGKWHRAMLHVWTRSWAATHLRLVAQRVRGSAHLLA